MFTAVLFTTAKIQKPPKCPSVDEWIKMCGVCVCITHIHMTDYYSATEKDEILSRVTTWMGRRAL